ncbi:hypothetical protein HHI36_011048 [Cryptolaemus montrouzieri]|uniref:Uncharacterized protein n=1 Tax=Cryptolaemus montrouzieri TaxID=559131 RepID=A0ABD2MKM0_9CUCU
MLEHKEQRSSTGSTKMNPLCVNINPKFQFYGCCVLATTNCQSSQEWNQTVSIFAIIFYNFQRQLSKQKCPSELVSAFGIEAPHQFPVCMEDLNKEGLGLTTIRGQVHQKKDHSRKSG